MFVPSEGTTFRALSRLQPYKEVRLGVELFYGASACNGTP